MTEPNPDMLHDAGQAGFAVFQSEQGPQAWILHGEGSFVMVMKAAPGGGLGEPDDAFEVAIYFEIPDQPQAWARVTVKGFHKALLYGRQVLTIRSTRASMWECRRVLFATPDCSDERDEGIDTQASLLNDFTNWREAYLFPWGGVETLKAELADGGASLLATPNLLPEQVAWLKRFIARWEMVSAEGRA